MTPSTGEDRLREALRTPMYPWLAEYGPEKAWDEAMELVSAALHDHASHSAYDCPDRAALTPTGDTPKGEQ